MFFVGTVNLFQERQATTHLLFAGGIFSASVVWVSQQMFHVIFVVLFIVYCLIPELSVDAIERRLVFCYSFRITANQGFYLLGLYHLSPTYASAIQNTVPAITFAMAAVLRCYN